MTQGSAVVQAKPTTACGDDTRQRGTFRRTINFLIRKTTGEVAYNVHWNEFE